MSAGTQQRQVRVSDPEWDAFGAIAARRGTNRSAMITAFIRRTIARDTPKDPK